MICRTILLICILSAFYYTPSSAQKTRFTVAKIKRVDGMKLTIADSYILNDTLFYKPNFISRNNIEYEKCLISNVISLKHDPISGGKLGIFCGAMVSFGGLISFGSNNKEGDIEAIGTPFLAIGIVVLPPILGYLIGRNYTVWQKFDLDSIRPPVGNYNLMLPDRKLGLSIKIPIR